MAGPTGSGKSALAMAFALSGAAGRPVEIISVDSAQVYRGLDVGTAKPSLQEREAVPHHLIDIIGPEANYSAARFAADATRLAREIRSRGHLPMLVGGTLLYFKALREGLDELPPANAAVRAQIDAEAAAQGWPALHAELAKHDGPTAARLAPADAQRIQRALEVFRISGRPLSDWHTNTTAAAHLSLEQAWPMLSLIPQDRAWLHQRLQARLQAMWSSGLWQEVLALRARPGLHAGLPAMRCVGYRQIWQAFDEAPQAQWHELAASTSPEHEQLRQAQQACFERALAATRQLAKRQMTWLRSTKASHILAPDLAGYEARAMHWLAAALQPSLPWLPQPHSKAPHRP